MRAQDLRRIEWQNTVRNINEKRKNMPCKNKSVEVASDGSCLRCGADQGERCHRLLAARETKSIKRIC